MGSNALHIIYSYAGLSLIQSSSSDIQHGFRLVFKDPLSLLDQEVMVTGLHCRAWLKPQLWGYEGEICPHLYYTELQKGKK